MASYDTCRFSPSPRRGRFFATLRRVVAFPGTYINLAVNPTNLSKIEAVIRKNAIDVMHIEHFHYAKYACLIRSKLKKVIVYHDLHHTIYRQKAQCENRILQKLLLWVDSWKYYWFQRRLDAHVDLKVFLNAEEMAQVPKKAVHIPHIANQAIVFRKPRKTDLINIFFIGSYKHPPNIMSVEFILKQFLPLLAERTDQFKIHIIGSGTEHFQTWVDRNALGKFVAIRGFISDINNALKDMDIALFPILYGAGIKTKTIDAMAAGIPVVATPQGVHGLDRLPNDCIGVAEKPEDLVDLVLSLMNNFPLRLQRSLAGKQYIRNEYTYEKFSDRVHHVYQMLTG